MQSEIQYKKSESALKRILFECHFTCSSLLFGDKLVKERLKEKNMFLF
jgi:hypothetical protein